ncbi:winged helix-turn-helix transcriptional regulator [Enterococcus sp. AZ126]|uniref:winged helix-turn-helix transcriptional regulator n=1 Tax=Enterococcus sp. AZ126 TaxID=2774635 RepID=UPI003F2971AD
MNTRKKRVAKFIQANPTATNQEIAQELDINENSVKAYISQLKRDNFIKVKQDKEGRKIETLDEYEAENINSATAQKLEIKKEAYTKLLNRYMDDFDLTDDIDIHLKLGNSILRILDNL